jgi:ribosome-binding factor A
MDSRRQLKIASVIKDSFIQVLTREGKGLTGKAFVTVTNVTVTSDLTLVRFYLSVYNADADEVVQKFNERRHELKRLLAEKIRFQLRRIPEIEFFKDDTLDYVQHMQEVFKKIDEQDRELRRGLETKQSLPKKKKITAKRAK